jgi:hypothetical protein
MENVTQAQHDKATQEANEVIALFQAELITLQEFLDLIRKLPQTVTAVGILDQATGLRHPTEYN